MSEYIYTKDIKCDKLEIKLYKVLGPKKGTKTVLHVQSINLILSDFTKRYVTVNPNGIDPMRDYSNEIYTLKRYTCKVKIGDPSIKTTIRADKKYSQGLPDELQILDCHFTNFVND
jgi:hypothetical protein